MPDKPQLILDIGGVLLSNLSPQFWQELTAVTTISYSELTARYKTHMSKPLWSGHITEHQFWDWLCEQCSTIDRHNAHALLQANLKPLPALNFLQEWSRIADIHLLSNHRMEWISPHLADVRHFITSMTISSTVGATKPNPDIYKIAAAHLNPKQRILFIDDLESNLMEGSRLGWHTLIADGEGKWLEQVIPQLSESL